MVTGTYFKGQWDPSPLLFLFPTNEVKSFALLRMLLHSRPKGKGPATLGRKPANLEPRISSFTAHSLRYLLWWGVLASICQPDASFSHQGKGTSAEKMLPENLTAGRPVEHFLSGRWGRALSTLGYGPGFFKEAG